MLLQSCACWSRKGRMTGSDRRCIWPLTIARSLASRKPWRALDGGGGSARAGGMTGLDRRRSFVCQPEFHGRLGEMSEVLLLLLLLGLSWWLVTHLVWRRLLLLLLRVVVPWASQFSAS
jgi:hypothetical protein